MGRQIDERIVQMRFENGQFERGVQTSIKTVQQLKQGLDFEDSIKGFENLDKAAKDVKMDTLVSAVEKLNDKFSLLGIIGVQTLQRITDKAINLGEQLIKSLSTDQISAGWTKFENKTGAVQTIMAATAKQFTDTGEQMEFVNAQLDKLNWFTDETSYNFVDMVANIGKFTSNNIALDESVTAMQGIANWAAISGANAGDASRAMYNLSQAISSGALKLQDWMSIENANMGTAAFKEMAIQSAIAAGTLKKSGDKIVTVAKGTEVSVEKFRDTLSEGWLNKDALMSTLDQYGKATNALNILYEHTGLLTSTLVSDIDEYTAGTKTASQISKEWGIELSTTEKILEDFQSDTMQFGLKAFKAAQEAKTFSDAIDSVKDAVSTGWMKSFELIFGDYLQAKDFWTDIANSLYDIFAASGEARNEMLQEWNEMGGRDLFIDSLYGSLGLLVHVLDIVKESWNTVFPPMTAERLIDITEKVHDVIVNLISMTSNMDNVKRTLQGIFAIISIAVSFFKAFAGAIIDVVLYMMPFCSWILQGTAAIGDFLVSFDALIKETNIFTGIFRAITSAIKFFIDIAKQAAVTIGGMFSRIFKLSDISNVAEEVNDFGEAIVAPLDKIKNSLKALFTFDTKSSPILEYLSKLKNAVTSILSLPFEQINFETVFDILNIAGLSGIISGIKKLLGTFSELTESLTSPFESIGSMLGNVSDALSSFALKLKSTAIIKISVAIGILAASLVLLSSIKSEKLESGLAAVTTLLFDMGLSIFALGKILASDNFKNIGKVTTSLVTLSVAVLLLSTAVKKLSELDWNSLSVGLVGVGSLCAMLVVAAKILSGETKYVIKGSVGLIAFASAIRILTESVLVMATLKIDELIKGLAGVGALIGEIVVATQVINKTKINLRTSVGLISLAYAIQTLSVAINALSALDSDSLIQGLTGIGVILSELTIFTNLSGNAKRIISTAISVEILSLALSTIVNVIQKLSVVSSNSLGSALIVIGVALGEMTIALNLLQKSSIAKSTSFLVTAAALNVLAGAFIRLSSISMNQIASGLIALGGSLTIITLALNAMKNSIGGAVAITIFSTSLNSMVPAIERMGNMRLGDIAKSLVVLAGTFTVIGLSANVLKPLIPTILSLSVAFSVFGAGVFALGSGIAMLSAGILSLATSVTASAGEIVILITSVINTIPQLMTSVARGLVEFAKTIADGAPEIEKAITSIIFVILTSIKNTAPALVETIVELITLVINTLADHAPELAKAAKRFLSAFAKGFSEDVKNVSTALSLLLPSLAAAFKLLTNVKVGKETLKQIGLMALILAAFGAILIVLSNIPIGDIGKTLGIVASMSILVPVLAASLVILSHADVDNKTVGQFAVLSLVVASLGFIIANLGSINGVDKAITVSAALAIIVPTLVAAIAVISKIPNIGPQTIKNTAIVGVAIDALLLLVGSLVAFVGWISGNSTVSKALENAPYYCGLLGTAVGSLVGGFIGSAFEGVASTLPILATKLSEFGENMKPFFEMVSELDGGLITKVGLFAGVIIALTAADFLSAIGTLASGVLNSISEFLGFSTNPTESFEQFGEAIAAFANKLDGVDADKVKSAAEAAQILASLEGNLPPIGGLLEDWLGKKDIGDFGARLEAFGEALKTFSDSIVGIDSEALSASVVAAEALVALENGVPRQGGKLQEFLGSQDIAQFGQRLSTFGMYLRMYSYNIEGISEDAIIASANAAKVLINLEDGVPRAGGMLQSFLGSKGFDAFGQRLKSFGESLTDYIDETKDVTESDISGSAAAVKVLAELEKGLDTTGGVGSFLFGDNSFAKFGENLKKFGKALVDYATTVSVIDTTKLNQVTAVVSKLLYFAPEDETLSKNFQAFGKNAVTWILLGFQSGVRDKSPGIRKEINSLMEAVKSAVTLQLNISGSKSLVMQNNGRYVVEGLIAGMKNSDAVARMEKASADLANKINESFKSTAGIASPSIVMKENGVWLVKGVAEGITSDTSAEEAAKKKAENIISAFQTEFDRLAANVKKSSLSYQLWETNEGRFETGTAKTDKELKRKLEEMSEIEDEYKLRVQKLEALEQKFGKDSAYYRDAENEMNETLLSLLEKRNEIEEYITNYVSERTDTVSGLFDKEISDISIAMDRAKTLYDTWEASEGRKEGVTEIQKQQKKLEYMALALQSEADTVKMYRAQMLRIEQEFGADSEAYKTAKTNYEKAVLSMYNQRNEIEDYEKEILEQQKEWEAGQRDRGKAYVEFVTNEANRKTKEMLEMSDEEFMNWAKQVTGYGIEWPTPKMPDLEPIIQSAFNEQGAEYLAETIKEATGKGFMEGLEYIASQQNGSWVQSLIDYYKQADSTASTLANGEWVNPIKFEFDETITEETEKKAKSAGSKIGKNISAGITESLSSSSNSNGSGSMFTWQDKLIGGEDIDKAVDTVTNKVTTGYDYLMGESTETGKQVSNGLANGIRERANQPLSAATEIAKNTSRSLRDTFEIKSPSRVTEEIGNYFIEGLVKGIQEKAYTAIEAARDVANSVSKIMSGSLKVKSPSRVTAEIGKYVSLGMAKGITDNAGSVEYASEELANKTIDMLDYAKTAIMNVLEADDDFSPQITPVLDMDELKRQARDIPSILDRQNGISTRLTNLSAQSIVRNRDSATSEKSKQMEEKVTNIEFTQNNYSPKALNRRDIYRQTRNQISQLKGATKIR